MNLAATYLASCRKRLLEYKTLGEKTFAQLNDAQLQWQPNKASNSIAVIVQHLHGNMLSRWTNFLTEDGEKSWRRRDAEFDAQPVNKASLLALWEEGWHCVLQTMQALSEADLDKTVTIRSQPLSVVDAINRQLAHYSYHVGQIVYIGRWLKEDTWQSLSIPKGGSAAYNTALHHAPKETP